MPFNVVLYSYSTSNRNQIGGKLLNLGVVLYFILHQATTKPTFTRLPTRLCYISIPHQTTANTFFRRLKVFYKFVDKFSAANATSSGRALQFCQRFGAQSDGKRHPCACWICFAASIGTIATPMRFMFIFFVHKKIHYFAKILMLGGLPPAKHGNR